MSSKHSHEELVQLLAPFAINAVDDDERTEVEDFLQRFPEYKAEVDDYRRGAALLAIGHRAAPSSLWERIESQIEPSAPPLRLIDEPRSARRETKRFKVVSALMTSAAAILVVALGAVLLQHNGPTAPSSVSDLAAAAQQLPGTQSVNMVSADQVHSASVVMTADGHGYLSNANLPALNDDQTYQLWAFTTAGQPVSVAVLGPELHDSAFMAAAHISTFAITVEQAGGVPAPTSIPLVSAALT